MLKFLLIEGAFSQEKKSFGEQDKGGGIVVNEQRQVRKRFDQKILEEQILVFIYKKFLCYGL